jgi:hypothetical protein
MQRVVIDTNLYIDWLNEGQHEDVPFQRCSGLERDAGRVHA